MLAPTMIIGDNHGNERLDNRRITTSFDTAQQSEVSKARRYHNA